MQRRRGGGGGIRACAAAGLGHNGRMEHANALVIPACEYRRTRWHNGRGWTREILCVPGGSSVPVGLDAAVAGVQAWDLRLSIAEVEAAAAYSSFPGIEREQVLLAGNGLGLEFADGERIQLLPPHQRARFSGDRPVAGVPLDGPVEVFNLMWRPRALHASVLHRPLVGGMWCFCDPRTGWAVYLLAGSARVEGEHGTLLLERGDSAWLGAAAQRRRHRLEGGGELLLVQLCWPADGGWPLAGQ